MSLRIIILIICSSFFSRYYGQNSLLIDSLRNELNIQDSPELINAVNSLAWKFQHNRATEAKQLLFESITISKKLNYQFGIAKANSHLGTLASNNGNYNEALNYFDKAKTIFITLKEQDEIAKCLSKIGGVYYSSGNFEEAIKNYDEAITRFSDKIGIANSYNNIALAYQAIAKYSAAIENFIKAAEAFNELNQPSLVATTYNNIGQMYYYQKEYDKATEYYFSALSKAENLKSEPLLAQTKTNIGAIYSQQKKYKEALESFNESSTIYKRLGQESQLAVNYNNMAIVYNHINQSEKAIATYKEAQRIFENLGNKKEEAVTLNNIGYIIKDKGDLEASLPYFLEAYKLSHEAGELQILTTIAENLSAIYLSLNKHEESLKYHTIYAQLNDSILQAQKNQLKDASEAKYQNKEKSKVINEQESNIKRKKSFLTWSLIGIGILICLSLVLYFFFRNSNTRASQLSDEKAFIELKKNELESILSEKEELLEKLLDRAVYKQESLPPHFSKLSKREVEVLLLLGEGLSDNEMADKLFVSVATVRTHLRRIYSKLLINNRVEAVNVVHKYDISSLEA
jgi:tetratricopeptide (TPR) repeat protein